jgi:catalase (peroxidase I)
MPLAMYGPNLRTQRELPCLYIFPCAQRGWRVLEAVGAELRGTAAEGRVSNADLVALGGAWAVAATGGPVIDVPVGARHMTPG